MKKISIRRNAVLSEDRKYRYQLSRIWNPNLDYMHFICLNPSTADEYTDDPTIRRCIGFAQSHNCGGMIMTNLFAFRTTNPGVLKHIDDPIGEHNDNYIKNAYENYAITVVAWGANKIIGNRDKEVLSFCNRAHYLRLTKSGKPSHPLYLPKDLKIKPLGVYNR